MRALITGASGWLGSELTKQLLEKNYEVRALVLESSKNLDTLKEKYSDKLEIILGNICLKKDLDGAVQDIDVVYHLAAKVHCQATNKDEEKAFFEINTQATKNLFEVCIENKVKRIVFYSSVSVYGESKEIISLVSKRNPITPYAKSKQLAEELGEKFYKEKNLPITIIQPVTVYGGDDVGNFEKMKSFAKKGFLPRFGDGTNKKTVIYFEDLIRDTIKIAENYDNVGKTFICGTENITLNEIIETFKGISEKKLKVIKFNQKITDFIIKICSLKVLKPLNKIARQVYVLNSNNEFLLEYKTLKYTTFKKYYSEGEL